MSYTVLARKYRSRTFDDLVGQEAVSTTLKNAVSSGRVHHGYLFTGTRGVGKTSAARVLAKALNCMSSDAPTPTPCCECESCKLVAAGEDIDVIEIDAASNTGVDNIRNLRDNAAYRPARSRFKVYIIDEVHMLSTGAFNALLKTLEEPPDHVKFILATTEIQKVPATIVSRCQRFDFKSIAPDAIADHLRATLAKEDVSADDLVIRRVARLANGSMRDALSLLDQLLSFGAGELTSQILEDVLPAAHDEIVAAMFDCVTGADAAGALGCVERSLAAGQTTERFCEAMVEHLRTLMLLNVCGADTDLVDVPADVHASLVEQAGRCDATTFVYMITVSEEVRRAVKSSTAARALIDAAVVRMALAENFSSIESVIARLESGDDGQVAARPAPPPRAARPAPTKPAPRPAAKPAAKDPAPRKPQPAAKKGSPTTRGVSSAEEAKARRDPKVQQAMELFDATLVSVTKDPPPAQSQANENSTDATSESAVDGEK
jgi:DNA polymerase III subunit gamma/tau